MIVAGIGSRRGVGVGEVLAAIDAALAAHGLGREALSTLATTDFKREEEAIFAAGEMLGLRVVVVDNEAVASDGIAPHLTRSALSEKVAGSSSVSEEAALYAAGHGARLLGPRVIVGPVTCALAESGDAA